MSALSCQHCRAKTHGVVLCTRCQTTAQYALRTIAESHAALFSLKVPERVRRRRGEVVDPTGNAASTAQAPTDVETLAAQTTNMLSTWVRALLDDRPQLAPPRDSVSAMSHFLGVHLRTIAVLEWAGAFLRDLLDAERQLHLVVRRSQGYWYAGICRAQTGAGPDDWCPQDVFVSPGERYVRCRACGHLWSVERRRTQVIGEARDLLLPVSVIARAAVALLDGQPSQQRLEHRLNKWVERGVIEDYGVRVLEGRPRRVYRFGDVLDQLASEVRPTREQAGVR